MGRIYVIVIAVMGMFGCMVSNLSRVGVPSHAKAAAETAAEPGNAVESASPYRQLQASDGSSVTSTAKAMVISMPMWRSME